MTRMSHVLSAMTIGSILCATIYLAIPIDDLAKGELRCEDAGAIVLRVGARDYAVNGKASRRYPPVQEVWNGTTYPEVDVDRLIVQGITLCDWESAQSQYLPSTLGE